MIRFVNESYYSGYGELSLDESCNKLRFDTADMLNELNMDILLSEHAYLLENGMEVVYEGSNSKSLKDRVLGVIHSVRDKIREIIDKCITWVQDKYEVIVRKFKTFGIKMVDVRRTLGIYRDIYSKHPIEMNKNGIWTPMNNDSNSDRSLECLNSIDSINTDKKIDVDPLYKKYLPEKKDSDDEVITPTEADFAAKQIFDTGNVIHDLRWDRKASDSALNELEKDIRETRKDDDLSDALKKINIALSFNSDITALKIKIARAKFSQSVKLIKTLMRDPNIANYLKSRSLKMQGRENGGTIGTNMTRRTLADLGYEEA